MSKTLTVRLILGFAAVLVCFPVSAQTDLTLRDLRMRLLSVQENQPDNPRDDSATVMVRTATISTELTLQEYTSEFVDEYEIYVMYINPNPNRPGHGSARFTVTRNPRF